MASATFQLKAVDETASAFASVQNKIQRINQTAGQAGKSLTKQLDVKDAMRTFATVIGLSTDKIADFIARTVTGQDEETQKLQKDLESLGEEAIAAQARLFAARSTEEMQVERLITQRDRLQKLVSREAPDLEQQVEIGKRKIELLNTEVDLIKARETLEAKRKADLKEYQQSTEAVGMLQAKIYQGDKVSIEERLIGLKSKESKILSEMSATGLDDLKRRAELNNDLAAVYQRIIPLQEEQKALGKEAGAIIAQGFEDAVLSGNKLKDVLQGLAQDLLRLFFRQQVTAPLSAGLGDFFNKLMGRETGGPVSSNTPYIVGEKGPELFVPRGVSGTIIPNHQLQNKGSPIGSAVNVTYNIASGVSRAELVPILENERKRLKAEIPDMVRRGGAYRAAFA